MPSEADHQRGVYVPARFIPTPSTISPAAQACLSAVVERAPPPPAFDKAAWRTHIATVDQGLIAMTSERAAEHPAEIVKHDLTAVALYELIPAKMTAGQNARAIFYIHGGGFTFGGGMAAAYAAVPPAGLAGIRAFSIDYRMPPDHPFPTGLDDCVEAYRWILARHRPEDIIVYGPSAGGGLAAAFVLKARDIGLPLPKACVLHSPEVDLTESGDTFETNDTVDVVLKHRLSASIALYADGHDLADPYLSPVFGDFSKGFPPTILTSGTRDLFLSNTVRLHRALQRAGVTAELQLWEAMPHGGFFWAPEDEEVQLEHARFIRRQFGFG